MRESLHSRRRGFTLVELLVVITIIGILIALLLPAVQAAREAARMLQCQNNIKQLTLGSIQHCERHGFFPTGGWGWGWMGDPDRGFTEKQPGGWVYNILPYIEQKALHDLGAMASPAAKRITATTVSTTVLTGAICPTRRRAKLYPYRPDPGGVLVANWDPGGAQARTDYAGNGGDYPQASYWPQKGQDVTAGDDRNFNWVFVQKLATGVIYCRSKVPPNWIKDGLSYTYLLGEKYICPDAYETGVDQGDDQNAYVGYDLDTVRHACTSYPIYRDRAGVYSYFSWGSAHSTGFNMAFCDGSVQTMKFMRYYDYQAADVAVYSRLSNRSDGNVIDAKKY
jgi:prepilin-type N-terminal cleavage/methylation domain-containing protein/prepilin-type processing-associated H-X9-DG protein